MRQTWFALCLGLAILARPVPAPAASAVTVPFDFVDNRIVVHLRLDGQGPFAFVLDSGASYSLSPQVVARLGLATDGSFTISGTGAGRAHASRVRVARVGLGPIVMRDQTFMVFDFDGIRKSSALPELDGLIGSELLSRYVVRIDYRAGTLTLIDPAQYVYAGAGDVLPISFAGTTPRVEASLDGIEGTFTIDTGDRMDVTLMEPVIERDHLLERYSPRVATITGWGIGGAVPGYVARAHDLELGTIDVKDPLLRLPTVSGGFFASHRLTGSIGTGVTDRFTVTFDYAHRRMILEDPAPDGRDAYDRSGLWLNQAAAGFDVAAVAPESPADQAGITAGERIVAVNGTPAEALSLASVRALLRGDPGTRVVLTVAGAERAGDVTVTLADLV